MCKIVTVVVTGWIASAAWTSYTLEIDLGAHAAAEAAARKLLFIGWGGKLLPHELLTMTAGGSVAMLAQALRGAHEPFVGTKRAMFISVVKGPRAAALPGVWSKHCLHRVCAGLREPTS